jgi:hypothetical protein
MIRTTRQAVTFRRPFMVSGVDDHQPAGTYTVETDEELIEGLSFSAYRRTSTRIYLPPTPSRPGITETVTIDPGEVDAALKEQAR